MTCLKPIIVLVAVKKETKLKGYFEVLEIIRVTKKKNYCIALFLRVNLLSVLSFKLKFGGRIILFSVKIFVKNYKPTRIFFHNVTRLYF